MTRVKKIIKAVLLILLGVIILLAGIAAATPIPTDPVLAEADYGTGVAGAQDKYSGLDRAFPDMNTPANNPITDEKVSLGKLLFFDPILSESKELACATCHHPDLGFADGQTFSEGAKGTLPRHTPSLWNVAYAETLFWDGRENSLEAQVLVAMTHADEMGSSPEALVADLQAIPEYVELFAATFPDEDDITIEQVTQAIASFERTLISDQSPFDKFVAGNFEALTPPQRRGLNLFRSAATRCFDCHVLPTFDTETFRVIGVPSDDVGRAGITNNVPAGAFAVPTLRNVALTAPYMHNGSFATLEEVVAFYAEGGGRAHGVKDVDTLVNGFDLTEQEQADLIAFLIALTDESGLPAIPDFVPSGLPVVPAMENPARALVAETNTITADGQPSLSIRTEPITLRVKEGQTIQEVVDQAQPGDTVMVPYGEYHEMIVVDINDFTLLGEPNDAGNYPILHGDNEKTDGIIASGNNFEMGFFEVRHYTTNGVLVEGSVGVHLHDLVTVDTGVYGVYPTRSEEILVERVVASEVWDAGVYVGKSNNAIIRNVEAFDCVVGIEAQNTSNVEIYDNYVHDNTTGIFINLRPNLPARVSINTKIYNNRIDNNNRTNNAPDWDDVSSVPYGVGITLLGVDSVEAYDNEITNNDTGGVGILNLSVGYDVSRIDVGPNPENNWIHDNHYAGNGGNPDPSIARMGVPGADVVWDVTGDGNTVDEENATLFPPVMPTSNWPTPVRRIYWHTIQLVMGLMG